MTVLVCPRDGSTVIELKTKVLADAGDGLPVTGYWCEEGHKLDETETPTERDDEALP